MNRGVFTSTALEAESNPGYRENKLSSPTCQLWIQLCQVAAKPVSVFRKTSSNRTERPFNYSVFVDLHDESSRGPDTLFNSKRPNKIQTIATDALAGKAADVDLALCLGKNQFYDPK